jgi:hypothetical protein
MSEEIDEKAYKKVMLKKATGKKLNSLDLVVIKNWERILKDRQTLEKMAHDNLKEKERVREAVKQKTIEVDRLCNISLDEAYNKVKRIGIPDLIVYQQLKEELKKTPMKEEIVKNRMMHNLQIRLDNCFKESIPLPPNIKGFKISPQRKIGIKKWGIDTLKEIITFKKSNLKQIIQNEHKLTKLHNEIRFFKKLNMKHVEKIDLKTHKLTPKMLKDKKGNLKKILSPTILKKLSEPTVIDNITLLIYQINNYVRKLKMTIERRRWTFYPHHALTLSNPLRKLPTQRYESKLWLLTPLDINIGHHKLTKLEQFWCSQMGYYPQTIKEASEDKYCKEHPKHMEYYGDECRKHGGKGHLISKLILMKVAYILYKKEKNSYIFRYVKETFDYLSHRVKDYYFRTYYMIFGSQEEAQYEHKLRFRRCIPIKDQSLIDLPDEIKEIRENMISFSEEFAMFFCPNLHKLIKGMGISVLQFKKELSIL